MDKINFKYFLAERLQASRAFDLNEWSSELEARVSRLAYSELCHELVVLCDAVEQHYRDVSHSQSVFVSDKLSMFISWASDFSRSKIRNLTVGSEYLVPRAIMIKQQTNAAYVAVETANALMGLAKLKNGDDYVEFM